MLTVLGTFRNSSIIKDDGEVIRAYPYKIDYPVIDGRRAYYQLKSSNENADMKPQEEYWIIINWIFTD